ncbi:MAG: CHRD domain-containing protein [Acidobacteria bacterium]|nr:CHRD domain-containing protein [Acidobacteriota bacterium]
MRPFLIAALCAAVSLVPSALAQSVESIPFRLNMSPANEVPAVEGLNATGFATVWAHVVRNAAGRVMSGTVDFTLRYQFPGEVTFTGLHIHRGNAGTNGPVVIDTRITAASPIVEASGRGEIARTAEIAAGSASVEVLEDLIRNPGGYYLNLHTTANPGGAVRAQMARAQRRVYGTVLSPENEVPAVTSQAQGFGFMTILAALSDAGQVQSSEVTFEVSYTGFAAGTQFTGMHIHVGNNGANGPVTIDTGLTRAQNVMAGMGGAGGLKFVADVNVGSAAAANTVLGIWNDPGTAYLNVHTVANPGGEIRAQLRGTERVAFTMTGMSPANEVPAITNLNASGEGVFEANLLRRADGTAMAALAVFNVNYRFPGETTFTGLHIHTGPAGANGPVTIDSGIRAGATVMSAGGSGNLYRTAVVTTDAQIASMNQILSNPDNQYLNLHTMANPGGAVRAQLAPLNQALPSIEAVLSAVSDQNLRRVAPGGLMTIFGQQLAELAGNLDGWQAPRIPSGLNGTSVNVGGRPAAILNVDPSFVLAQVPVDATNGEAEVIVRNTNGASAPVRVTVSAVAPAVFFDLMTTAGNRAVAYSAMNGSQVTMDNAAAGGTMVGVFSTGLGLSTPAQQTGAVAFGPAQAFAGVRVTVGGRDATGVMATLIPGYVGFSQIVFMVPTGLSGAQALVVESQGVRSNSTLLYVR